MRPARRVPTSASRPWAAGPPSRRGGGDRRLRGHRNSTALELEPVVRVAHFLEEVAPLYADSLDPTLFRFDGAALRGMLPVSAMGHGIAELRERGALERLPDVEAEISRVRRELGDPPPVSPLPEVITTQAVYNVFEGDRYATISQEIRDYCLGYFGTPPEPIDPDVRELVNGREEPITCRPADLLEPGLPAAGRSSRARASGPTRRRS